MERTLHSHWLIFPSWKAYGRDCKPQCLDGLRMYFSKMEVECRRENVEWETQGGGGCVPIWGCTSIVLPQRVPDGNTGPELRCHSLFCMRSQGYRSSFLCLIIFEILWEPHLSTGLTLSKCHKETSIDEYIFIFLYSNYFEFFFVWNLMVFAMIWIRF